MINCNYCKECIKEPVIKSSLTNFHNSSCTALQVVCYMPCQPKDTGWKHDEPIVEPICNLLALMFAKHKTKLVDLFGSWFGKPIIM